MADRLKVVLPSLIHTDQNGFVCNRYYGNNVLDVYSLISLAQESADEDCVLLSLDIEKAFDSVCWDFLRNVLWGFGFPEEFINWIFLTHQNAQVRILNNGHLSHSIPLKKGLAQGCGLSPFLFILAIEGLANTICEDSRIPGIPLRNMSKKVAQIADDTLLSFIGSPDVVSHIKNILDHFSQESGLCLNYDKSIFIALGPHPPQWFSQDCISMFQKTHISQGFKYLGITASDKSCVLDNNYDITLDTVPGILSGLPNRPTCISGRVLHLKQLVVSKFVYKFQLLPTPNFRKLKLLNSSMFNYIWNYGRHRLRQELVFLPKHEGGFDMVTFLSPTKL